MKILDVLNENTIIADLKAVDKKGVIEELALPVAQSSGIESDHLIGVLMEREQLGSTGIGGGVGIPHGKIKDLETLSIGFGLSRKGVDFEAIDGRPTHIFFLLVTPEDSRGLHLTLLGKISKILKNDHLKNKLCNARSRSEIISIIKAEEG